MANKPNIKSLTALMRAIEENSSNNLPLTEEEVTMMGLPLSRVGSIL